MSFGGLFGLLGLVVTGGIIVGSLSTGNVSDVIKNFFDGFNGSVKAMLGKG